MANSIRVSFWLHRSKINGFGEVPIQLRLTYQSHRLDKSTDFYVRPIRWNEKQHRLKANVGEEMIINNALHSLCKQLRSEG